MPPHMPRKTDSATHMRPARSWVVSMTRQGRYRARGEGRWSVTNRSRTCQAEPTSNTVVLSMLANAPHGYDFAEVAHVHARMCARQEEGDHWLEGYRKAGLPV